MYNVENESKIWIHRPIKSNESVSNSHHMTCDDLQKNILTDKDGSFLGSSGVLITQPDWNCTTYLANNLSDISKKKFLESFFHNYTKTLGKENSCSYVEDWKAWNCKNITVKLLIIERMDQLIESIILNLFYTDREVWSSW